MPRKVFTPQFKEQAVRLASAPGAVVENVAHELNIATWTLRRWMKEQLGSSRKAPPQPAHAGPHAVSPALPADADLPAQVKRLEAEVRRLRMERDILKNATAFFAAEDQQAARKEEPR